MLNEPDLQPDAVINRWIQGIKMFTFELVHVPAERHKGPDALSRRPLGEKEVIEEDDNSWLDEIALMTIIPYRDFPPFLKIPQNLNSQIILHTKYNITSQGNIPLYHSVHTDIVLAIKPEFAEAIRTKKKNHEYRKYKIEPTVIRFWLYETEPVNICD